MAHHGWRLIPGAPVVPQHCAVFPHIGNASGRMFIDTGMNLNSYDPHIYISDVAAEELGKYVGMVPRSQVEGLETEVAFKDAEISILEGRVRDLEKFKAAVELIKHDIREVTPSGRIR